MPHMRTVWQTVTRSVTKIKTAGFIAALTVSLLLPALADPSIAHATGGINNTRGDAWGTQEVAGSGWLGGLGVAIYSNGSQVSYTPNKPNNTVNGVVSGEEWQCVEMVNRLYLTSGWTTANWPGNGGQLYDNALTGLTKQLNGSITFLNPGDTLVLQDSGAGHAAIIKTYNGTTGAIQIASQNTNVVYDSTFSLSNKTLSSTGWGTYSIKGVVHHPATTTASNRPGALARSSTDMDTFYQSSSGNNLVDLYWNSTDGWASTYWGDSIASAPSAIARTSTTMDVFFRNTGNNLVDRYWNSSTGWNSQALTTNGTMRGNPTVLHRDSNSMDVFYRDSSGNLVDVYWNSSTGWSSTYWADNVQGDPSAIARDANDMDIFFRNTGNNLAVRYWNTSTSWNAAALTTNGHDYGDPGALYRTSNDMSAFYKDNSNNLVDEYWDSTSGWNSTYWGDNISGTPSAISRDSSDMDIFFRTTGNNLVDRYWNSSTSWNTATKDSSGHLSTDPSAIDRDSSDMDVFYGNNGNLDDENWNSTDGWNQAYWTW